MKYIELYTYAGGEMSADIYETEKEAIKQHEFSESIPEKIVESVVIKISEKGKVETVKYWKKQ